MNKKRLFLILGDFCIYFLLFYFLIFPFFLGEDISFENTGEEFISSNTNDNIKNTKQRIYRVEYEDKFYSTDFNSSLNNISSNDLTILELEKPFVSPLFLELFREDVEVKGNLSYVVYEEGIYLELSEDFSLGVRNWDIYLSIESSDNSEMILLDKIGDYEYSLELIKGLNHWDLIVFKEKYSQEIIAIARLD